MKGLLPSRLLKVQSGVKRLSNSLYRFSRLRKRPKRLDKLFLQVNPSLSRADRRNTAAHLEDLADGERDEPFCKPISISKSIINTADYDADDDHDDDAMESNIGRKEDADGDSNAGAFDESESDRGVDEGDDDGAHGDDKYANEATIVKIKGIIESGQHDERENDNFLSHSATDGVCHIPSSNGGTIIFNEDMEMARQENQSSMLEEDLAASGKGFSKGPIIFPDWEVAMCAIAEIPEAIVFICGGKNTGKSTFARYLLNSLLDRYGKIGFLDTDVGQPEFTPSGCLSFHVLDKPIVGLPALEMRDPERCYFFGDTSPKSNPKDYLESVFSLFDHFKSKYIRGCQEGELKGGLNGGRFPLVINTHGWIQGVGFDVLIKIIDHVLPTHVVQTLSKTPSKNLPMNRFWDLGTTNPCSCQLLYISNALEDHTHLAEIKFDARELRDLRLLSYFQKDIKEKMMPTSRLSTLFESAAVAMACVKPFEVPISAIQVVHQHFKVPACESAYSLNAALVGLGVASLDSKLLCLGLGIVRAVDITKGLFYVITPLKLEALQQVDTFLQGRMEIPVSFLKAPGYISPYLCNHTLSIEGTGSAVMGKAKKKALPMLRSISMRTRVE